MKTTILTNIYQLILFISLFFLFNQADCSRKKDLPRYYLTDEFKEYVIFKEGTFWVYKNFNGLIDTVKVVDVSTSFTQNFDIEQETINTTTNSIINGDVKYSTNIYNYLSDYTNGDCIEANTLYLKNRNVALFMCCCYENSIFPIVQLDSMVVDSVKYFNVIGYEWSTSAGDTINPTTYYYVKNIGLIKKEQPGVFNWELIDYYIIQ